MKIELHYAPKDLTDDIPCIEFSTLTDLADYFKEISDRTDGKTIYLFTCDDGDDQNEIWVTDSSIHPYQLVTELNSFYGFYLFSKFFLFEYSNFEEAYKTAIDMREGHPLCYSNNNG